MEAQFKDKVALVTGGNSGMGKAAAQAFAQQGAKVVVAARRVPEGEETVAEIIESGGEALFIRTDVTRATDVENMVGTTIAHYSRLDYAFNNAGMVAGGPVHEFPQEEWERIINVNLTGAYLCVKSQIAQMLKQGRGVIVNNSSVAGLTGGAGASAYFAAKHGVVGLTKSVALEVANKGIRVNAICPGFIDTPMVKPFLDDPKEKERVIGLEPMGRIGDPKEIAETVLWLCSDAASFITGLALPVDGGMMAGIPAPE
ncbi:MAG: SDR family oxidoreductase [Candidatus Latescibacteria bacterium]|nr:SDR family oxidoreductase [Candidatus Latescibacterota bacterium]